MNRGRVHIESLLAFMELFEETYLDECYHVDLPDVHRAMDCGGSIGMATLLFKQRWPSARISVFEPLSSLRACLEANLKAFDLQGIDVVPFAVSDADSVVRMDYGPSPGGVMASYLLSRSPSGATTRGESIERRRLSGWLRERVDVLKMDIEGAEGAVISELATETVLSNLSCILREYHYGMADEPTSFARVLAALAEAGFAIEVRHASHQDSSAVAQDLLLIVARRTEHRMVAREEQA